MEHQIKRRKLTEFSLATFVQKFFPIPTFSQFNFNFDRQNGILLLFSTDQFSTFLENLMGENEEQSCILVDALTWLQFRLRANWPYLVNFCINYGNSDAKYISRIAFVRPLPIGNEKLRFSFVSPIYALNAFGMSQIGLVNEIKIENFSPIELEGIEIGTAEKIEIKLVEGEDEGEMPPAFLEDAILAMDEAIKKFFAKPRLLFDGDLFKISRGKNANWVYQAKFSGNNENSENLPKFVEFGQSECIELRKENNSKFNGKFPQKYSPSRFGHFSNRNFLPKSIKKLTKEIALQFLPFFGPNKCPEIDGNLQEAAFLNPFVLLKIESDEEEFDALLAALIPWIRPSSNSQIIFVATCSAVEREEMPERLKKIIHWEFGLEEGDEKLDWREREAFLREKIMKNGQIDYCGWDLAEKAAEKTKGFSLFEMERLIWEVKKLAMNFEGKKTKICLENFEEAMRKRGQKGKGKKNTGVDLGDVGGLEEAKILLKEALGELVKGNEGKGEAKGEWGQLRRRSGILLYGPPGCGKTLLAKAVANEFGLAFFSVKGPELLSQYVGESERNLRELFAKGRKMAPAVLFFDELDSLAPNRGRNTDSGGVMDRMVSQLLTELDGCQWSRRKPIFVMGATNRPDLLDPCLIAPGRFEKMVPILPAADLESKERILGALCKNEKLERGLGIREIAQKCPEAMSGAELAGLVRVKIWGNIQKYF